MDFRYIHRPSTYIVRCTQSGGAEGDPRCQAADLDRLSAGAFRGQNVYEAAHMVSMAATMPMNRRTSERASACPGFATRVRIPTTAAAMTVAARVRPTSFQHSTV